MRHPRLHHNQPLRGLATWVWPRSPVLPRQLDPEVFGNGTNQGEVTSCPLEVKALQDLIEAPGTLDTMAKVAFDTAANHELIAGCAKEVGLEQLDVVSESVYFGSASRQPILQFDETHSHSATHRALRLTVLADLVKLGCQSLVKGSCAVQLQLNLRANVVLEHNRQTFPPALLSNHVDVDTLLSHVRCARST